MNLDPESAMRVGLAKMELFLPYSHSLKEKRYGLRKIKDRIFAAFKISVHEVSHQDKWQRATLGFAVVGNDAAGVQALVDKIFETVNDLGLAEMVEVVSEVVTF